MRLHVFSGSDPTAVFPFLAKCKGACNLDRAPELTAVWCGVVLPVVSERAGRVTSAYQTHEKLDVSELQTV